MRARELAGRTLVARVDEPQLERAEGVPEVARQVAARGADLYLEHFVRRQVLILAADLEPGDSGSALVDGEGRVMGIAFAISLDREDTAYALSTEELMPLLEREHVRAVDTGDCLY